MRAQLLATYADTLDLAGRLTADVPDDRFAEVPHAGSKHPGWVLGHHCLASGMLSGLLADDEAEAKGLGGVPMSLAAAAAPGTEPTADRSAYGSRDDLLAELTRVHEVCIERFSAADDALLARPLPIADYRSFWPTIGDAAFYLLGRHEPWHLGQLTAWRQAAGFGGLA